MIDSISLQIMLIACLVAIACVMPGIFLVLRGIALMSDAISHSILLGIVLMFFMLQRLDSPFLFLGAIAAGLGTVFCTQWLINTRLLKHDAAIGIVFPLFFSIAVILISKYIRNAHLDIDMVLLGEIALAPFNCLLVNGINYGPIAIWILSAVIVMHGIILYFFCRPLLLSIFDEDCAYLFNYHPKRMHYLLMTMTSLTAVTAFNIVGSIVVVALMICPVATALLCSRTFAKLFFLSIGIAIMNAVLGYMFAAIGNVSIAGSIAVTAGFIFFLTLFVCYLKRQHCIFHKKMNGGEKDYASQ